MSQHDPQSRPAVFSERALAFAVDYALFAALWAALVKAADPSLPVLHSGKGALVGLILAALFLVYQAFFSCEGRVSLGKRLLGLRVVGGDGEPLSLGAALFRTACYGPSSFFYLGFFWSLVDPRGRTWHDLAAGSVVVTTVPLTDRRRLAFRGAAGLLLVAFAGVWGWRNLYEERYLRIMTVAHAKAGLQEVRALQELYKLKHGRYAGGLIALSSASVDPQGFLRDASALYRLSSFRFKADAKSYAVVARAKDPRGTLVAVSGP